MIVKERNLTKLREKYKNKKIVFAGGAFDVFHIAHVRALKSLRQYGDIVVVGIGPDRWVKESKGLARPIISQKERTEIVDAIRYVDFTVSMRYPKKGQHRRPTIQILKLLRPDIFISVDKDWDKDLKIINNLGIEFMLVNRIHPSSTSTVIKKILKVYK